MSDDAKIRFNRKRTPHAARTATTRARFSNWLATFTYGSHGPSSRASSSARPAKPSTAPSGGRAAAGWPKIFTHEVDDDGIPSEVERTRVREALLAGECEFMRDTDMVGFLPLSAAGAWFGSLGECGDESCSCNRLTCPTVRPKFREFVVRQVMGRLGGTPVRYASLAAGLLLTDVEILCGLVEAGAKIESIMLVDSAYIPRRPVYNVERYNLALTELAAFFVPAMCAAFYSTQSLLAWLNSKQHSVEVAPNVLIACDAGASVANGLMKSASELLENGGVCCTLINGGKAGASALAWQRLPREDAAPEDVGLVELARLTFPSSDNTVSVAQLTACCSSVEIM